MALGCSSPLSWASAPGGRIASSRLFKRRCQRVTTAGVQNAKAISRLVRLKALHQNPQSRGVSRHLFGKTPILNRIVDSASSSKMVLDLNSCPNSPKSS